LNSREPNARKAKSQPEHKPLRVRGLWLFLSRTEAGIVIDDRLPRDVTEFEQVESVRRNVKLPFYFELRDRRRRLLYRGSQEDPLGVTTEHPRIAANSASNKENVARPEIGMLRTKNTAKSVAFTLLVPELPDAETLWIYSHEYARALGKSIHSPLEKLPLAERKQDDGNRRGG
jgi:hypothetical protein